uniref:C2 domain-containing protein n=1 Tax=Oryzias latipes TaxID=8090 RepID=A0A3P9MIE3_ORYLA
IRKTEIIMWILEKIRRRMESIPLEMNRYIVKSEEDIFSPNLHGNIITPGNIPEFCLPPRLCKKSSLPESENASPNPLFRDQLRVRSTSSNSAKTWDVKAKKDDAPVPWKATKKPLPFSAESYGLAGIYESPNTRRKESLFHSKSPIYILERNSAATTPDMAREVNSSKKVSSGFLPLISWKGLSEAASTESETPSSDDSSSLCSPCSAKSSNSVPYKHGRLKETVSCPSLIDRKEVKGRWEEALCMTTSLCKGSSLGKNLFTLAPPVIFPLDVLHCQKRLQCEHVLPLQGRGQVRLSAEHMISSTSTFSGLATIRLRVVSVEGLWDPTECVAPDCAVNLCLTPGKQQQQESAIIRKCHNPVFNEDFFFTELSQEDLQVLNLKLKVVDKSAAGKLRRGKMIGLVSQPLSQLLPFLFVSREY